MVQILDKTGNQAGLSELSQTSGNPCIICGKDMVHHAHSSRTQGQINHGKHRNGKELGLSSQVICVRWSPTEHRLVQYLTKT